MEKKNIMVRAFEEKWISDCFELRKYLEKDHRDAFNRTLKDKSDKDIEWLIKISNKAIEDSIGDESLHDTSITNAKHVIWYKWELHKRNNK